MWAGLTEALARRATRVLFAVYLVVSGTAIAFPARPPAWPLLAAAHVLGIVVLLGPGPVRRVAASLSEQWPRTTRVIADWYPLVLIPALYSELAILNLAVFDGRYFDSLVLGWEERLFGGQPSRELAGAWPLLPVSELLHFSYISYYLIIYGPPIYLYLRGRRAAHQQVVFTLMLTFFAHYVFFIYFPVQGPRYIFPAPVAGDISSGFFYNLAHRILEAGSSRGAAFPSSHVGVSFAQTALAFQLMPRWAPLLLLLSSGLAVGAVYGGFHYATDAAVGLLFGLLLWAAAPRIARRFGRSS